MKIDRKHAIVGKTLEQIRGLDIGTLYPVIDNPAGVIIGVYSAEFGTPEGFVLSPALQAYVPNLEQLEDPASIYN